MSAIPIFGEQSALPQELAGLTLEGVEVYPDRRLGVSFRYGNIHTVKADVYLYDLGFPEIPTDLRAQEVVGWFREACHSIVLAGQRGIYLDLEMRSSRSLHLPANAPEPFCLWASFAYRQAPVPGVAFTGKRVSHLALRTDRGFINKVRYTYPEEGREDSGLRGFMIFLTQWTTAVQNFREGADA